MAQSVTVWMEVTHGDARPRHRYVAHVVFEVILGWDVHWALTREAWNSATGLKVQYGGEFPCEQQVAWIPAQGLLEGEVDSDVVWSDAEGPGVPGQGRLPFGVVNSKEHRIDADWWSWVFWMTTRMEEHVPVAGALDPWGRFQARFSMAHAEGWLSRPEVECRVLAWASALGAKPERRAYQVIPTVDVDSAFAYLHRHTLRKWGAVAKDAVQGNWSRLAERRRVMRGLASDPFDTYAWLEELHQQHGRRARYFMLLADRNEHDRGLAWNHPGMKALVHRLSETADLGIHPGVASHRATESTAAMRTEKERLEILTGAPVTHARQHYLLQRYPTSWQRLVEIGIEHDHTMGYADCIGFRAGMSRSYRAYDVTTESILPLTIHPVAAMDATLKRYMGLTPDAAVEAVGKLADEVRKIDGDLTLLWHNETVSDRWDWTGWRTVYEQVLDCTG